MRPDFFDHHRRRTDGSAWWRLPPLWSAANLGTCEVATEPARACRGRGWDTTGCSVPAEALVTANLLWLAAYRHPRQYLA